MTSAPAASEPRLRADPAPEALHALLTAIALLVADICVAVAIEFCRNPRLIAEAAPFWRALNQIARAFVALARHQAAHPAEPQAAPQPEPETTTQADAPAAPIAPPRPPCATILPFPPRRQTPPHPPPRRQETPKAAPPTRAQIVTIS